MLRSLAPTVLMLVLLVGCTDHRATVRDAVLQPGMTIEAKTAGGTVVIAYKGLTRRLFAWDGQEKITNMIPREEEWMGAWGLYQPADWPYVGTRVVAQESVRNFSTDDAMYRYLDEYKAETWTAYSSDGLVVGFFRRPQRDQVNVDVWQLEVNGKKPSHLRGADDSRMRVTVLPSGH